MWRRLIECQVDVEPRRSPTNPSIPYAAVLKTRPFLVVPQTSR